MTTRSRAQVDKDIARRQAGIKVKPSGSGGQVPARKAGARSTAQVDKDVHIRSLGGKVAPRGRLSDAATGRLGAARSRSGGALGGLTGTRGVKWDPSKHPRNGFGEFR